jgi:ABC-type multidrug transport system fused ATPase/permease subunit
MKFFFAIKVVFKVFSFLNKRRKIQLYFVIISLFFSSLMEVFSIGMIIPFIAALIEPSKLIAIYETINILDLMENITIERQRLFLTIIFVLTFILSNTFRLANTYIFQRISRAVGADLNLRVYKNFLDKEYSLAIKENSSLRISLMTEKMQNVIGLIYNFLTFFSSGIILFSAMAFCFILSPTFSILSFIGLIVILSIISKFLNSLILRLSENIMRKMSTKLRVIQETFGALRQIILDKSKKTYSTIFEIHEQSLRKSEALSNFVVFLPKHLVEVIALIVLSFYAYYLTQFTNVESFQLISFLGFIGFASSRLLPISTGMHQSVMSLMSNLFIIDELLKFLDQKPSSQNYNNTKKVDFRNNIKFENVSFKYDESSNFELKNLTFEIKKGENIGIVGETGFGKSTIVDILIGLLKTNSGKILIDNKILDNSNCMSWQSKISHVPQDIFLMDRSIAENIASIIGTEKINYEILKNSIKFAELEETVNSLHDKENTLIGERGIYLSGGQKQRIGLARAFYNQKEILILDEATSSLDIETEKKIMENIKKNYKDLTVIQISHRLQTLKFTNKIFEFKKNSILKVINYKDIIL